MSIPTLKGEKKYERSGRSIGTKARMKKLAVGGPLYWMKYHGSGGDQHIGRREARMPV